MRSLRLPIWCFVFAVAGASLASAETLPLNFAASQEDTAPLGISYTYTGGATGQLAITRTNAMVKISAGDGSTAKSYWGNFNLQASIDPNTGSALGGSINLLVKDPAQGNQYVALWNSTTLTGFGYTSDLKELDFKFIQTGPSFMSGVSDGSQFGIIVYATNGYNTPTAAWGASFSGSGAKNDGAAIAPAPRILHLGAGLLGLAACGSCLPRLRRRIA